MHGLGFGIQDEGLRVWWSKLGASYKDGGSSNLISRLTRKVMWGRSGLHVSRLLEGRRRFLLFLFWRFCIHLWRFGFCSWRCYLRSWSFAFLYALPGSACGCFTLLCLCAWCLCPRLWLVCFRVRIFCLDYGALLASMMAHVSLFLSLLPPLMISISPLTEALRITFILSPAARHRLTPTHHRSSKCLTRPPPPLSILRRGVRQPGSSKVMAVAKSNAPGQSRTRLRYYLLLYLISLSCLPTGLLGCIWCCDSVWCLQDECGVFLLAGPAMCYWWVCNARHWHSVWCVRIFIRACYAMSGTDKHVVFAGGEKDASSERRVISTTRSAP